MALHYRNQYNILENNIQRSNSKKLLNPIAGAEYRAKVIKKNGDDYPQGLNIIFLTKQNKLYQILFSHFVKIKA